MHVACDSDLKASLHLADRLYYQAKAEKVAQRRAGWRDARERLEIEHAADEKA